MRLDNPLLVRWEYASEERLTKRNSVFRRLIQGENPEEWAFRAVAEARPRRVLDVGCGPGDMTERIERELGVDVSAVDISPRMVELARERGLDAAVADVQELPYADESFDCVAACWILYHTADLERAIAECARVLRPGGRLVAATLGDNLREVWALIGDETRNELSFNAVNGAEKLRAHFASVEQRDVVGTLVFPDPEAMRELVAATITRAHLAPRVPAFEGEFRATIRHAVFVAEKAA